MQVDYKSGNILHLNWLFVALNYTHSNAFVAINYMPRFLDTGVITKTLFKDKRLFVLAIKGPNLLENFLSLAPMYNQ